jgi:hypothetical protein
MEPNDKMEQQNFEGELSDDYKLMIDKMLEEETNSEVTYVSEEAIRKRFER